jgi:hypothetical protein
LIVLFLVGQVLGQASNLGGVGIGSIGGGGITTGFISKVYQVTDFGAKGNGVTDDHVAEQNAIDAACNAKSNGFPISSTVYWPSPSNFYNDNGYPLYVWCSGIKLQGPSYGTNNYQIIQNINGTPVFVYGSKTTPGAQYGPSLVTGSTQSLSFTGATNAYNINMNDVIDGVDNQSPGPNLLNGKSALLLDAYIELNSTSTNGSIIISSGNGGGAGNGPTTRGNTSCANILFSGGKVTAQLANSSGNIALSDNTTTFATGTIYEETVTYDGAHARLFTNGLLVSVVAMTGTIYQPYWEVLAIGGGYYPYTYPEATSSNINGYIDGVQVQSAIPSHFSTASTTVGTQVFTPLGTFPTVTSSTIVIANPSTTFNNLIQLEFYSAGGHVMFTYPRIFVSGTYGVEGVEMYDLSMNPGRGGVGIIGQEMQGCHFHDVTIVGGTYGVYELDNDFENGWDELYVLANNIDFYDGGQSGLQNFGGDTQLVGGLVGFATVGDGTSITGLTVQLQSSNIWGYIAYGDTGYGYFNCSSCGADNENPGPNFLGDVHVDSMETFTWVGGAVSGSIGDVSAPAVYIDGNSSAPTKASFVGTNFNGNSFTNYFVQIDSNAEYSTQVTFLNPYYGYLAPVSNYLFDVSIVPNPASYFSGPQVASGAGVNLTANTLMVEAFYLPTSITFTKFQTWVSTLDAAHAYDVGLYTSAGTLLVDTGAQALSATGVFSSVFQTNAACTANHTPAQCCSGSSSGSCLSTVTLSPGLYWLAWTGNSAVAAFNCLSASANAAIVPGFAATTGTSASGILPSTFTPPSLAYAGSACTFGLGI